MIYITGDLHGCMDAQKLKGTYFNNVVNQEGNILLVLGDSGFTWPTGKDQILDFYKKLNLKCKIISILGNNENYDDIYSRVKYDYCGGKAVCVDGDDPDSSKILYLMNGYIYNFEGKTFAVLGGADSYDAPFRCKAQKYLYFPHPRIEHKSWWKDELPSVRDFVRLKSLLIRKKVDFILTHDCTNLAALQYFNWSKNDSRILNKKNGVRTFEASTVRNMNDSLLSIANCRLWLFGHHHRNRLISNRKCNMVAVFDDFVDVNNLNCFKLINQAGEVKVENIDKNCEMPNELYF